MANPWDRMEHESDRAFAAFEVYLYLEPPDDGMVASYRIVKDRPDAEQPSVHYATWSRTFKWNERRKAFRNAKAAARADGVLTGITEHWRMHAKAWEDGHTKLLHMQNRLYVKAIEIFNKGLVEGNYNMGHGVQMGKLFLEIQKHTIELLRTAEANKTYEDIPDAELDSALDEALANAAPQILEESFAAVAEIGPAPARDDAPAG